jgi:hypothetical protein
VALNFIRYSFLTIRLLKKGRIKKKERGKIREWRDFSEEKRKMKAGHFFN